MKILVVEDSPIQAQIIEKMLSTQGWEVILAENGQEGMKKLKSHSADIILSDLEMPIIDGYDFCRLVKGSDFKHIPFILLSAFGELNDKLKGFEIGADDYLIKPVSERELYARIRAFQRTKDYQDQLKIALENQKIIGKKLENAYEKQMQELEQAKVTQQSILPVALPQVSGIQMVTKYTPMNKIGGDFYDILQLNEQLLGIFVADVTGHGISAALISFMASSAFKTYCGDKKSAGETVELINEFLLEKMERNKFVTAWYGIYDLASQKISYSSAGHPPSLVVRPAKKEIYQLDTEGIALGLFSKEINPFETDSFQMELGDKIFIFTDGIFEMPNAQNQLFGMVRLQEFLQENAHLPLKEWVQSVYDHVLDYSKTTTYSDDITIVALEVTGKDNFKE